MASLYLKCFLWERCAFLRYLAISSLECLVGDVDDDVVVGDVDDDVEEVLLEVKVDGEGREISVCEFLILE